MPEAIGVICTQCRPRDWDLALEALPLSRKTEVSQILSSFLFAIPRKEVFFSPYQFHFKFETMF